MHPIECADPRYTISKHRRDQQRIECVLRENPVFSNQVQELERNARGNRKQCKRRHRHQGLHRFNGDARRKWNSDAAPVSHHGIEFGEVLLRDAQV